ncbi:hypothetical protein JXQ70_11780 [bacterium]|nr:hypothetical protein [bacterium]
MTRSQMILVVLLSICLCSNQIVHSADNSTELTSIWKHAEITIDGDRGDWQTASWFDRQKLFLGVENDADFLYLMLTLNSRTNIQRILSQGLTVRFEPQDGSNTMLKLRYPAQPPRSGGPAPEDGSRIPPEGHVPPPNSQERQPLIELSYSATERPRLVSSGEIQGLEVNLHRTMSSLVYELKVPWHDQSNLPFTLNVSEVTPIAVTIEATDDHGPQNQGPDRSHESDSAKPPPRSGQGGPGAMSGGFGRPPGNHQMEQTDQLVLQFLLKLAVFPTINNK